MIRFREAGRSSSAKSRRLDRAPDDRLLHHCPAASVLDELIGRLSSIEPGQHRLIERPPVDPDPEPVFSFSIGDARSFCLKLSLTLATGPDVPGIDTVLRQRPRAIPE
jgi:hypothetical protein